MQKLAITFALSALLLLTYACGSSAGIDTGKAIGSAPAGNNLTVTLSSPNGVLKHGDDEFFLSFKDASGKTVDVGAVALNFYMPGMGTMSVMNEPATFTTTNTPGVYRGRAKVEMAGEWQAQISYEGPAGKGKVSLPVPVQ